MSKLSFGKYKGMNVNDLPDDYLEWGINKLDSPKWRKEFQAALQLRKQQAAKEKQQIKDNINDPQALQSLVQKYESEIESEIANSDSEWEWDYNNVIGEARLRAEEKLKDLQIEVEIEKLQEEFIGKEDLTLKLLAKIEAIHYEHGLDRCQFSSKAKYELAREYVSRLEKIRGF